MKKFILFLTLILFLGGCDNWNYEKGIDAWNQGNHYTALKYIRPLANSGYAKAQNHLGVMYARGQGVSQSHVEAARWFERSAINGHKTGKLNMYIIYSDGLGVKKNETIANYWYNEYMITSVCLDSWLDKTLHWFNPEHYDSCKIIATRKL